VSRGLGERQRQLLARLDDEWIPLWQLAGDPDDANEMAKARSAVRGLERRGMVVTCRMSDPARLVSTNVIMVTGTVGSGWTPCYGREATSREWHGLWVRLSPQHGPLHPRSLSPPR
jgi:hypothetical protein